MKTIKHKSFTRPLGEQFEVPDERGTMSITLLVIPATFGCKGCYYDSDCLRCLASERHTGVCDRKHRDDFVNVIFKKNF